MDKKCSNKREMRVKGTDRKRGKQSSRHNTRLTNDKRRQKSMSNTPPTTHFTLLTFSLPHHHHSRRHYGCWSPSLLQHTPSLLLLRHQRSLLSQSFPHAHQSDPRPTDQIYSVAATIAGASRRIACLALSLLRRYDSTWPRRSGRRGRCIVPGRFGGLNP